MEPSSKPLSFDLLTIIGSSGPDTVHKELDNGNRIKKIDRNQGHWNVLKGTEEFLEYNKVVCNMENHISVQVY